MARQCRAGVPYGRHAFDHLIRHQLLAVDAADCGGATVLVDLRLHLLRRVDLVKFVDRADIGIAWVRAPHARRVGDHRLELLPDHRLCIRQIDGVAVTFAHLASIGTQDLGKFREMLFGFREDGLLVDVVEAPREFPCEFQMGQLVFAYRNEVRLVQQDVRGLEHGIAEKAVGAEVFFFDLVLLFFVGRIPLQPGHGHHHGEQEMQHGMFGDMRLDKDSRSFRVDAGSQPIDQEFAYEFADAAGVGVVRREGMPVGDEEEALIVFLEGFPVFQGAEIVA